ncbi:unnamed protein product [Trichobilharzia regenti]|nr:unnamed protein product [Trichobilharzia regenti]
MAWKLEDQFRGSANASLFPDPIGMEHSIQLGNALSVAHLLPDDSENMYHPYKPLTNGNIIDGNEDHSLIGMVNDGHSYNSYKGSFNTEEVSMIAMSRSSKSTVSSALGFTSASPILCQWRINAASGERIRLNFTHIDISGPITQDSMPTSTNLKSSHKTYELNQKSVHRISCINDYVEIRDGYYFGSPLIGKRYFTQCFYFKKIYSFSSKEYPLSIISFSGSTNICTYIFTYIEYSRIISSVTVLVRILNTIDLLSKITMELQTFNRWWMVTSSRIHQDARFVLFGTRLSVRTCIPH